MKRSLLAILLLVQPILSQGYEEKLYKQHGNYKIFYSAFNSSFIDYDIAVANNIVRGKGKGLVNIRKACPSKEHFTHTTPSTGFGWSKP